MFVVIVKVHTNERKVAESLLIKETRPTLNTQEKSLPFKLFN